MSTIANKIPTKQSIPYASTSKSERIQVNDYPFGNVAKQLNIKFVHL